MSAASDLAARLALVRRVIERSPEPLHLPLGLVFHPLRGGAHLRDWEAHADRCARGVAFTPATLYVHVPFCARVCTFCLLSASRTPGRDAVAAYVAALLRHIDLYEPVARGLRFHSLHVGGGTPTLLDERQLDALLTSLSRFRRAEGFRVGVEAHPATATPARLATLARHGVHRVSLGVETLTPRVLDNVNRGDQTPRRVHAAVAEARKHGLLVNLDLLAGLPGEDDESWARTVAEALALEPDSMSVNRFLGENSDLARHGLGHDPTEKRRVDGMLLRADAIIRERRPPRWPESPLTRAGFGSQYVWERSDDARRYFQDDMIGPASTLAFGYGALGHLYGRHFSAPAGSVEDYVGHLSRGEAPDVVAAPAGERFEMAFFVAEHACRGDLTTGLFARVFRRELLTVFGEELRFLASRGLLARRGDGLVKTSDAGFQVTHLLAFLLRDTQSLAAQARALEGPRATLAGDGYATLSGGDDLASLEDLASPDDEALKVDVGDGLDSEAATRLAALGSRRGLRVLVRGSERRETAQYEALDEELPPSMLWVRIAIRASQAARGAQRLAVRAPVDGAQTSTLKDS